MIGERMPGAYQELVYRHREPVGLFNGWLIEAGEKAVKRPKYLSIRESEIIWTTDVHLATPFITKLDAMRWVNDNRVKATPRQHFLPYSL